MPLIDRTPLHTFRNAADGIEGRVWASVTHPGRFDVTLYDLDAGETVPVSHHGITTEAAAIAFARKCAGVSD